MKIFNFILSIILLVISCLPCEDSFAGDRNMETTITTSPADNQNDHHAECCSPLCICGCCSVTHTNQIVTSLELVLPVPFFIHGSSCINTAAVAVSLPVWQPPQLLA